MPEHISNFLQAHKFVLGLKETLRPLVRKEKCQTLNEAIDLAIVLEDGKRFSLGQARDLHGLEFLDLPLRVTPYPLQMTARVKK